MGRLLCPHWIPQHYDVRDRAVLRAWQPKAIKVVWTGVPAHLDAVLEAKPELIVVRDHALSEAKGNRQEARQLGALHAEAIKKMADGIKAHYSGVDLQRFAFEGLNEPELWGGNPPGWVAEYEAARLRRLHAHGLRAVVGNINTGWPADYEQPDSPVNWEPFAPMFDALTRDDYLGLHEYWWLGGPLAPRDGAQGQRVGGWLWDAGRYLHLPHEVPILITECGLDDAVRDGVHKGWQYLEGDEEARAQIYVAHLLWYADQLRRDRRVVAAFIFTHDHQDGTWESFNTRNDAFLRHFLVTLQQADETPARIWGDERVWRWQWLCEKYGEEYGIDPRIVATVLDLESGGKADAVSPAGAVGLMQVMPREKMAGRPPALLLKNPDLNLRWGCRILRDSIRAFNGSLAWGLVAYYRGVHGTRRHGPEEAESQRYLRLFAQTWQELWTADGPASPLPGDVATYLHGATPMAGPDMTAIRWHAEEAVREIEAAQSRLAAARQRLLARVITPLYQMERPQDGQGEPTRQAGQG